MNLSIRKKIIIGFVIIFVLGLTIGLYGVYTINHLSSMSDERLELQNASASISDVLGAHYDWRQNLTMSVFAGVDFTGSFDSTQCSLGKWRVSDMALSTASDEITALLEKITEPHNYIHETAKVIIDLLNAGRLEEAQLVFVEQVMPRTNEVITYLHAITEEYDNLRLELIGKIHAFEKLCIRVIIIILVTVSVLGLAFAYIDIHSIMVPLRALAKMASAVKSGDFSAHFEYHVDDELGALARNLMALINTFKSLINDMKAISDNHAAGDIEYFIEPDGYEGEFRDVVLVTNALVKEYVDNTITIMGVMQSYAEGDFNAVLAPFPGKKALANEILDAVVGNLRRVSESVSYLVEAALQGQLDQRVDDSAFKGEWRKIVVGMDDVLEAIDAPLKEVQQALSAVSEGKLNIKVAGAYKGQFAEMALSTNKTIDVLYQYIGEISMVLNAMAGNDLDHEITRDYIGEFSNIKSALNNILSKFNVVISDVISSADQVSSGAKMIAESSMSLAQGAVEQASSVEELTATVTSVNEKTQANAENSKRAADLSGELQTHAADGNNQMKDMLKSMEAINEASNSISKIITIIKDIAFQTNLLALNASIEAAHAGVHGAGFSVVADEVRSLAVKSQEAANNTKELIETSIQRVNEGTSIAMKTDEALERIVSGVAEVSRIIEGISVASNDQALAISQINDGVGQIAQVVQNNSATSEEGASAAQQLSSQADILRELISVFKLRMRS